MNRRSFLTYIGLSAIPIAIGGYVFLYQKSGNELAVNLEQLFDPLFKDAAENLEPGVILAKLRVKGVINENGKINTLVVKKLAKTDQAIEYQGRYYSRTELELYSLAFLMHEKDVLLLKGHDLMGGDYDSFKVSSAEECLQACESTPKCMGFTYAKDTHPNSNKHNSCWLKDGDVKYNVNDNYISGAR